jgi:site-specific DNA recombinase
MSSSMSSAAIYARVSSVRQKKDETIGSQTAALRAHAEQLGLDVPDDWVFEDEGHSGATLVRPALERLRDLVAGVGIDVVLCYSPDRLARKFAYQALLIEEFTRAGTRVEFIKGPRGDSPEDQLLVQFQGMFAEYEKAQIMERYRRGKTHRAKTGSINVLSGAPFGYRYLRKNTHTGAAYEIVEHEAALVVELFRRYADDGASIAELARWLSGSGVPTRTGKHRWDRSVIWGMLHNPAYAGRAVFGKTMIVHESPALNRIARLQGRSTPRASKTVDRPRSEWTEIPVPAIVSEDTFDRVAQRLADNKRFASRNSRNPSLLQGLAACAACGYGYYRASTRTTNKKIHYYRCLGSDDYRYEGGRVCANKPVRADYLDTVVWDHITALLTQPQLIRAEINKRLDTARSSDPAVRERQRLDSALAKASSGIARMIEAFGEQLITIDELRARMPDLRARETNLRNQIQALDAQLADREAYLALATDLEGFLSQLHTRAETSTLDERRRVLKLLVKDVLIGPEKITIRHRIPLRERTTSDAQHTGSTDTEGEHPAHCPVRWGRADSTLRSTGQRLVPDPILQVPGGEHGAHQPQEPVVVDVLRQRREHDLVVKRPEAVSDIPLDEPGRSGPGVGHLPQRGVTASAWPEPVGPVGEDRFVVGLQQQAHHFTDQLVRPGRQTQRSCLPVLLRDERPPYWTKPIALETHCFDDAIDLAQRHAVHGLPCDPDRHRPLVGVDAAVGQQIQLRVEHLSIQSFKRPAAPAALTQDIKHRFGVLHCAYLPVPRMSESPGLLRPCGRLSRPPWPVVTPATTMRPPSP